MWKFASVLELALVVAIVLAAPVLAGVFLDRLRESSPLFLIAGTALGITASTVLAVRKTRELLETQDKNRKELKKP